MSALRLPALLLAVATALTLAATAGGARAEKADRLQPIVVEADKPGTLDLQRQVVVFNGNVEIKQGTMVLRAERIEVREQTGGYRAAVATGAPGRPATYRQKRDGVDEIVEAQADRIEYDARAGTLRFVGNSTLKRLRDGAVADQISGALILWDDNVQTFSVAGSETAGPGVGSATPGGRVRAVLTPRAAASAPAAPTSPASAPR